MRDEPAYRVGEGYTLRSETGPCEAGCVVILLESPHKAEFAGDDGPPLGPLRDRTTRKNLEAHLPRLLEDAERWLRDDPLETARLMGRQVVLANAVQFQTSLHRLMRLPKPRLQKKVRDCVWELVFDHGGADNMLARLHCREPLLVLAAPTAGVRDALAEALRGASTRWPWRFINVHPGCWWRWRPELREEPHYLHRPENLNI